MLRILSEINDLLRKPIMNTAHRVHAISILCLFGSAFGCGQTNTPRESSFSRDVTNEGIIVNIMNPTSSKTITSFPPHDFGEYSYGGDWSLDIALSSNVHFNVNGIRLNDIVTGSLTWHGSNCSDGSNNGWSAHVDVFLQNAVLGPKVPSYIGKIVYAHLVRPNDISPRILDAANNFIGVVATGLPVGRCWTGSHLHMEVAGGTYDTEQFWNTFNVHDQIGVFSVSPASDSAALTYRCTKEQLPCSCQDEHHNGEVYFLALNQPCGNPLNRH